MNEQRMTLQSVRVRNFKAIVDGRTVRFGPLYGKMSGWTATVPSAANPIVACKLGGRY